MILHFSHIGFTEALTFIAPGLVRIQDSGSPQESGSRHNWPIGPNEKDSKVGTSTADGPAGSTYLRELLFWTFPRQTEPAGHKRRIA
jgi:hypothetical protein